MHDPAEVPESQAVSQLFLTPREAFLVCAAYSLLSSQYPLDFACFIRNKRAIDIQFSAWGPDNVKEIAKSVKQKIEVLEDWAHPHYCPDPTRCEYKERKRVS